MSLVFAGITPHSPLLIPTVGKDKQHLVMCSQEAISELAEEIYTHKLDTLIILSPYTGMFETAFSMNAHDVLKSDLSDFGDLVTQTSWSGSPTLAAHITQAARAQNIPVRSVSNETVDYGISIPLTYLLTESTQTSVLPIGCGIHTRAEYLAFGALLKEVIMHSSKRIGILVSGHLSHALQADSPEGYNAAGAEFDETLVKLLEAGKTEALISLDQGLIDNAKDSIYHPLLIALGVLREHSYRFETYCYESPVGVGYVTGTFHL